MKYLPVFIILLLPLPGSAEPSISHDSKTVTKLFENFMPGLNKTSKPSFKQGDFEEAAKQSHRLDISEERNKYVEKLLQSINANVIIGAPIDQVKKVQAQV